MPPGPDEVDIHHGVAAEIRGEEMEPQIAVEQQHAERRGQDREGRDDEEIGGQRGPAEDRHPRIGHARGTDLEDRRDEIDAGEQRADAGDLDRPQIVVDTHPGRELQLRQRRIGEPAGLGEFADHERHVDEEHGRGGQPEGDRVEGREGDVANAELQRHREVHQADHEGHGDEEDHDRAVGRKDLVVMLRRQIALRLEGQSLLRAHHDRVGEAAQQHDERQRAIHDADALVVDRGDPLAPQIGPVALDRHDGEGGEHDEADDGGRRQRDGLVEGYRRPVQLAQHHVPLSGREVAPGAALPAAGIALPRTIMPNRPGSTDPNVAGGTSRLGAARAE